MYWVIIVCLVLFALFAIYAAYKIAWYLIIMCKLKVQLRKYNVKFIRPFYKIIFGSKGKHNFVVNTKQGRFSVAVISYITNHSRLNIEKRNFDYFIDVRRKKFIFNDVYYHSGEPEMSIQHRSEMSLGKTHLRLESADDKTESVMLFYPKPKELTYADRDLKFLHSGDEIGSYKVMFWDDLKNLIGE